MIYYDTGVQEKHSLSPRGAIAAPDDNVRPGRFLRELSAVRFWFFVTPLQHPPPETSYARHVFRGEISSFGSFLDFRSALSAARPRLLTPSAGSESGAPSPIRDDNRTPDRYRTAATTTGSNIFVRPYCRKDSLGANVLVKPNRERGRENH